MNFPDMARERMQLENTLQEKYAQKRKEAMQKTKFPTKKLHLDWLMYAVKSMKQVSILNSGVAPDMFKSVALLSVFDDNMPVLTLEQVACLCNVFETLSADQLGMTIDQYCAYQEVNKAVSNEWNTIVSKLTDELREQYEEEVKAKITVQNSTPLLTTVPQA